MFAQLPGRDMWCNIDLEKKSGRMMFREWIRMKINASYNTEENL